MATYILFCEGKIKNILNEDVHLTTMNLRPDFLTFTGISKRIGRIYKDDLGFYFEIPISNISNVSKKKSRLIHYTAVETYDKESYSIIKIDSKSLMGNTKTYAEEVSNSINQYLSGIIFCPNCGKENQIRNTDKCPSCSWMLSSSAEKCPRCGWTSKACGNCGETL